MFKSAYIGFPYVNMIILIYILEFKHLRNFPVAMLLNIVPLQWLHRRGSNSQCINFKSHFLKICHLATAIGLLQKKSHSFSCLYWRFVFLALKRTKQSITFDSQCIDGYENSETKFIILIDYNLAWSTSKAFYGWPRRVS